MIKRLLAVATVAGLGLLTLMSPWSSARAGSDITVTWIGHAAFEVVSPGGTKLLIDPLIANNPVTPEAMKDISRYEPDAILLSHTHGDHVGDAVEIAKKTGAKVVGVYEHVSSLDIANEQKLGGNVGGKFVIGDVTVNFVTAIHSSSPGGRPMGYVIQFADGRSIYHTGDTWIFGDMSLIQEIFKPNIILLQAGGGPYNQDPKVAALAIKKYFNPQAIIPMHYGTWPILSNEADVRSAFGSDVRVKIMQPGDTAKF